MEIKGSTEDHFFFQYSNNLALQLAITNRLSNRKYFSNIAQENLQNFAGTSRENALV